MHYSGNILIKMYFQIYDYVNKTSKTQTKNASYIECVYMPLKFVMHVLIQKYIYNTYITSLLHLLFEPVLCITQFC